jgi:Type II secretion system (T2SS), protein L
MTTLRVLLAAAPSPTRADAWALFDDAGICVRTGRDLPGAWPTAQQIEVVLAAAQVRLAIVTLPPVPPARLAAAVSFALEDQLAGPQDAQHLAVSPQSPDGRVRVAIVSRALLVALTDRGAGGASLASLARIIAEPDLAPTQKGWCWCVGDIGNGEGFVRRADGSAFPVSPTDAAGALPPELLLALAQSRRDRTVPEKVRVDADVAETNLARWTSETGVTFVRGTPWRWQSAPASAFDAAVDLRQGALGPIPAVTQGARLRLFVPAMLLAIAAIALHVGATFVEWGSLKVDGWRQARAWTALVARAGIPPDAAATPASAQAALAHRYAELRHMSGLPAPDDALPLLARAAPALRALPPGAVKSAIYADGHWTLDLARADAAQVSDLDGRLRLAGLPALVATSASGTRVRIGTP